LKILIIGGGAVSENWHIPAAIKLLGIDNVLVAEPDYERRHYLRATFGLHAAESDFRNLLEKVNVAMVATPPHLHHKITNVCLKSRIPVLCEKPLANSSEECNSILKIADLTKTSLGVCHNYRLFPNRLYVRDKIKAGYFGKNVLIDIHEGGAAIWPTQTGYTFKKELVPGGVLLNNGIHSLDFMLWCFGKPVEIEYFDDSIGGLESNAEVRLTFHNGCKGRLRISRTCQMKNIISVKGDSETAHMGTLEMNRVLNQSGSEPKIHQHIDKTVKNSVELSVYQLQEFIKAFEGDGRQFCTGKEGAAVIDLIEHCYMLKKRRARPEKTPIPGIVW
jgi:predicted dehydrogenase